MVMVERGKGGEGGREGGREGAGGRHDVVPASEVRQRENRMGMTL